MRILTNACLAALIATTAAAEPTYTDNRSSPADVVQSLYNAINRHEYLRAWSYYRQDSAPDYKTFAAGYAKTASVELRLGTVTGDGAAGSFHSQVPVALRATATDGTKTTFIGCYTLTQVQPAIQEVPPFRPIAIDAGHLQKTTKAFLTAMGQCPQP